MKKMLLGLTMGAMVFSASQATTAEASFSSNTPTCKTQVNTNWSAGSQQISVGSYSDVQKQLMDQLYAQLNGAGFKAPTDQPVAQKPAATAKPVAQKPAATAKPVAQKPAATPVAEKPAAQPVAQKPATNTQPVAEKPATAPTAPSTQASGNISSIEQQVLTLTNQERAKAGLKALATDAALMDSARAKSADMSKNNYFSHTSPTMGSPFDQMKAKGIQYKAAAENIAMGQQSASEVVKAWMESPGHRANIMNGNFTHIGIGYVAQGNYWTQQFIQK
ncbi:CAP domain-containing protein [Paenisporosarcina quisquiliarum]|uniref:CAP domain-containing protein n=1 Tax=Paenisporosarcina quisquiliarum TaxID=365346 RepID=A0A9X3LGD3_9BACL|nr:CAP domain-containing protein [Paenisporosarcina quisquiliarum]MCZ8535869.1 CAP domain-containing protein [Paenisporosarcina quisquiliarum]